MLMFLSAYVAGFEPIEAGLAFGDQQRLEAAGLVTRHRNLDLAILGQDRFRARSIAAVAAAEPGRIALLVPEMFGQLGAERTLDQSLFELLERPVISGQILKLIIVSFCRKTLFCCTRPQLSRGNGSGFGGPVGFWIPSL
jgi:hypothetical protein